MRKGPAILKMKPSSSNAEEYSTNVIPPIIIRYTGYETPGQENILKLSPEPRAVYVVPSNGGSLT
jgi:hypothetical protein